VASIDNHPGETAAVVSDAGAVNVYLGGMLGTSRLLRVELDASCSGPRRRRGGLIAPGPADKRRMLEWWGPVVDEFYGGSVLVDWPTCPPR